MGSYIIKCGEIVKDADGNVTLIHATADLETGTNAPTDRKVKGTVHWLDATECEDITVMLTGGDLIVRCTDAGNTLTGSVALVYRGSIEV